LANGLKAWAARTHQSGSPANTTYGTETEFSTSLLSFGEANRMINLCAVIKTNGSTHGQCAGCTAGGK